MARKKSAARANVSEMRQLTKDVKTLNGKIHGSSGKGSAPSRKSAKS